MPFTPCIEPLSSRYPKRDKLSTIVLVSVSLSLESHKTFSLLVIVRFGDG